MERILDTPEPIELHVELGKGDLVLRAVDTTTTTVSVTGKRAEEVEIDQDGRQVWVIAPRRGGFFDDDTRLDIEISLPRDSHLSSKTGSADQTTHGPLASARSKSGSGEVRIESLTGPSAIETGSGDISVDRAGELQLKSGSGDIHLSRVDACGASTGSGDITIDTAEGPVSTKSGSGSLTVHRASADLTFSAGSGDLDVRRFTRGGLLAKNASGDISVGIPAGIPVWTDLNTVSGTITSDLDGAGEPTGDQDYIELRATSVSGDISLEQI